MTVRAWLTAAMAVLVTAALGGCAQLGDTSSVRPGLEIGGGDVGRVRVFFPPPVPGASPEQIVRGFLRSGAASDGDYDTSRSFLTREASQAWSPDEDTLVFTTESELTLSQVEQDTATVTAPLVARITKDGRYLEAAPGEQATAAITFARVEGEWRIAGLPEGFGRWIASADLRRLFQPYAVHYVAMDSRTLIRDLRWFPLDHVTSRLARAQLAQVPEDLLGVATTSVPAGARLSAESVSVSGGIATVELNTRPPTDQIERQNIWAQFVSTLTQDPGVVAVTLQVDGSIIQPPGTTAPVSDPAKLGFTPAATTLDPAEPLLRTGERLATFDPSAALSGQEPSGVPQPRPDLPVIPEGLVDVAVSLGETDVAAVTNDRTMLARWRDRERTDVPFFASGLTGPTFDVRDQLWIGAAAGTSSTGQVLFTMNIADPPTAPVQPVAAPWLEGRSVLEIRISPNGQRAAIISTGEDGRPTLHVAGVVRGARGVPQRLTEPVEFGAGLNEVRGLVWLTTTSFATLSSRGDQTLRPYVLSLDGTAMSLPETPDGVELTTTRLERQMIVRTSSGELLVRSGQLWVTAGVASQILVPGR